MAKRKRSGDAPKHRKDRYAGERWKPGEMREYLQILGKTPPQSW